MAGVLILGESHLAFQITAGLLVLLIEHKYPEIMTYDLRNQQTNKRSHAFINFKALLTLNSTDTFKAHTEVSQTHQFYLI